MITQEELAQKEHELILREEALQECNKQKLYKYPVHDRVLLVLERMFQGLWGLYHE